MEYRRCITGPQIMASQASFSSLGFSNNDVYFQATEIGAEIYKLMQTSGRDAVEPLTSKVIPVFELLEDLTTRCQKDDEEIAQLRSTVEKLEAEKADRAQDRAKFEQDLELIEENWQSEVKELLSVVDKLQVENKRLKQSLQNEKYDVEEKVYAKCKENEEQEIKVLTKLKETVDKQRQELRAMKRDLSQKAVDCEALQSQVEHIAKLNADLRLKNSTHKKQTRTLLDEKAELEIALHQKDQEVEKVKVMIKEREKFEDQRAAVRAAIAKQRESEEADEEIAEDGGATNQPSVAAETAAATVTEKEAAGGDSVSPPASPGLHLDGKIIIDLKDPNRPRFTLHELRQVLMERNELKTRLIEVEEELQQYRPKNLDYSGEEMLVHGPINREPDEKVFGAKESGIRKFLRRLLRGLKSGENDDKTEVKVNSIVCVTEKSSKTRRSLVI